ncbi:MAG: hypothetical protein OXG47_00495 [bacterium]|nr:hypothetical protein [bacterium]
MNTISNVKMAAKKFGQYLRFEPTATWRADLVIAVATASTAVFIFFLNRTLVLSTGWYWTVVAAGTATIIVLATIAQRRWDKPKVSQETQEESSADMLTA